MTAPVAAPRLRQERPYQRIARRYEESRPPEDPERASEREWLEGSWERWIPHFFRRYVASEADSTGEVVFAPHHRDFYDHAWQVERGVRPPAFVDIWSRDHGKSTAVELVTTALGAMGVRAYALYVSGTQPQADDHVGNIANMLTEPLFGAYYPEHADRDIDKFGSSKGWRRNRIRTAGGFTVDAIGLDTARARGMKLENLRPDLILFDDLDDEADSLGTVEKKIRAITKRLLPAGSRDLAVIACQNLVHEDSIFAQMADGRARFLLNRIVSGPIPAIEGLEYEEDASGRIRITAGTPTWSVMGIERCERIIADEGLEAFLSERQHEVDRPAGTLVYRRSRVDAALKRGEGVSYDPEAVQRLGVDPGFSQRACALAVQETSRGTVEVWKEWSFTEVDDDHIARTLAEHIVACRVRTVKVDAESPELRKAIKKHVARIINEIRRGENGRARDPRFGLRVVFDGVPFNQYKRLAIKCTRWMLQKPHEVCWGALTTERHTPHPHDPEGYVVETVPGIFRHEVKRYELEPGKDDEPVKEDDHGPDAWHAYVTLHLKRYLKAHKRHKERPENSERKDWIPDA